MPSSAGPLPPCTPGFEALLVFHYTVTAINELREPLHDEVVASVFRVEGDRLTPVEDDFEQVVLGSEFHPIKSTARRDDLVRSLRAHWFSTRKPWRSSSAARKAKCRPCWSVGPLPR